MDTRSEQITKVSLSLAVSRTGLTPDQIQRIVARRIVVEPLTETDLVELRRIRRLHELGVNLPGIEIIMRMRQRVAAYQADLARLERRPGKPGGMPPHEQESRPQRHESE